jgi:hypothetical protein
MVFGRAGGREIIADFDGGLVTSDAGALLLSATDRAIRLVERSTAGFRDNCQRALKSPRLWASKNPWSAGSTVCGDQP